MKRLVRDILALFRKEVLMTLKDKRSRFILIMPAIAQTLLFGYVASYDLNRVDYALLDEDRSFSSRELATYFDGSPTFNRVATLQNGSQIAAIINNRKALMVVRIGPHFESAINAGETAPVQAIIDGRNSNVAGIASGYATSLVTAYNAERLKKQGAVTPKISVMPRAWHNPNLETRWNIVSGMLAVLSVVQVMILAGQSVARERELGTFDQLLVTPFTPMTIMLGKALPPVIVGLAQATLVFGIAVFWFKIPFAGTLAPLYAGLVIFNFSIVGIGLCVSALTHTMQQAMLYCFSLLMPMILLSGFATPISAMPVPLQYATLINPARHGVELAQRVYLEGAGVSDVAHLYWPLLLIACVTLYAASRLFRTRLG